MSDSKSKVLVVGPVPPPFHGVSVATKVLLDSSLSETFSLDHIDLADRRGIEHVDKPDLYDVGLFIKQWFLLVIKLITKRPDLTYIPISQSSIGFFRDSLFIWPSALLGSRVVVHLHGGNFRNWYESRSLFMKGYIRATMRRTNRVIVLGETFRDIFDGIIPADFVSVVSNGLNWPFPKVTCNRSDDGMVRVLSLGTLSKNKGTLMLLEAIPQIFTGGPPVEVVIAGQWANDGDKEQAVQYLKSIDTNCKIVFPGSVVGKEKYELFNSSDIFVFPGLQQEGQPLVVLEAMAAGLPVVYTNRGCLSDTVKDGVEGYVVNTDNAQGLAEKINHLLKNPNLIDSLGCNARRRYEDDYSCDTHINKIKNVFRLTLSNQ